MSGRPARSKAAAPTTGRRMPAGAGGGRPAIYVSYDDAKAYVDWLREKSGKAYRLLVEAEWEYAARGGTNTPFAGGERLAPTQANFDASTRRQSKRGDYEGKTVEVGTFPPNPYGLLRHGGQRVRVGRGLLEQDPCRRARRRLAPRRRLQAAAWPKAAPGISRPSSRAPSARMSFPKGSRLNVIGFRVARPLE